MKFCVRYRTKDGRLDAMTVEADNRAGVFDELSRRGISAISISESEAKPVKATTSRKAGGGLRTFGLAACVTAVIAIAVGLFLAVKSDESQNSDSNPKRVKQIATHTQAKATGKDAADATDAALQNYGAASGATNGMTKVVVNNDGQTPTKKFRLVRRNEGKKKLFHNVADIYISRLVNTTPGSGVIGTMNYDRFRDQLEKALEQPITIDADDTPEEIDKKQAVIETRAELKKMMDDGVDIAQVMREAESEMRRLWNYKRSLHLELARARKEGKFNSEDMRDYVDAANKMLTDNGMEPLKHPEFWVRRMRLEEFGAKE